MPDNLSPNTVPGQGLINLECHGSAAVFSRLSAKYPLKLLSPRVPVDNVASVYILSYGGGLVGGDDININIDIGRKAILLLLSQVSNLSWITTYVQEGVTRM
jgi:urease accessory protein